MSSYYDVDGTGAKRGPVHPYSGKEWRQIKRQFRRRIWGVRVYRVSDSLASNPSRFPNYDDLVTSSLRIIAGGIVGTIALLVFIWVVS